MGDPTYECTKCGALLWFDEKLKRSSRNDPEFSVCCSKGKIKLPLLKDPPLLLRDLLLRDHEKSRKFQEKIRAYNMMFAFTSMSGFQDKSVNDGRGTYTYRLGGQNYHRIGDLVPEDGQPKKFAQLYFNCDEDETNDRINALG